MNAIMVCVNYTDLAAITIPYNRHHFDRVCIVTDLSVDDRKLVELAIANDCEVYHTCAFTADGATFNKWRALEEGLDEFGLRAPGWLCIMDADVLWPKEISLCLAGTTPEYYGKPLHPIVYKGQLCSPLRRMWNDWPMYQGEKGWQRDRPITEEEWKLFPIHRNVAEWAGYSQIFHTSDPVLGPAPWHQIDWKHAGGADSFFQAKWAPANKVRPPFEVLHLGPAGQNWYGRASTLADGTEPEGAAGKREQINQIWRGRAIRRAEGKDQFEGEKL